MNNSIIHKATEFSRDFELPINKLDTDYLFKTLNRFIGEEVKETEEAIQQLHNELAEDEHRPAQAQTIEEVVDGFGDIAFIAINGIYKTFRLIGHDHNHATLCTKTVLLRICNANLAKRSLDGNVLFKDGKVIKPEGWQPPRHADLVDCKPRGWLPYVAKKVLP